MAVGTKTTKQSAPKKKSRLEAKTYSIVGEEVGMTVLPEEIFACVPNMALIAQYVRVYLTNQRQGTVSALTRSEVTGSTKKIWRQKGTGRARHGAAKANLFVGGGVTFGPKPKEYLKSLNKKQKKQALFSALSQKAAEGAIRILTTKGLGKDPQTKMVAAALAKIGASDTVLFISTTVSKNPFVLSARNIQGIDIMQASTLNAYAVLNHNLLIFVDDALQSLVTHFTTTHEN